MHENKDIVNVTKCWVEKVVLGLNLCPFAHLPFKQNRIRYIPTATHSAAGLLDVLQQELTLLSETSGENIETTLLISPNALLDFFDYNTFLDVSDVLLEQMGLVGEIQIASFHPDYQFAETAFDDVENYTNRSPYPMLHLIREDSLEKAIATYPDADNIPDRNIARMNVLGNSIIQSMIADCTDVDQIK